MHSKIFTTSIVHIFSSGSLAALFQNAGFDVLDLKTGYSDQYLMIEAKPANGKVIKKSFETAEHLKKKVMEFKETYSRKIQYWTKRLSEFKKQNKRVVLWGSGSKGVVFLTLLDSAQIEYVVDINPHRQGTYMARNGQLIIAPGKLMEYMPDVVIIMNAIYKEEIQSDLEKMNLYPELLTV